MLKVGKEVFVLRSRRSEEGLIRTKISKVGRKYFYCEYCDRSKFDKITFKEINESNYQDKLYLKEQDYQEEVEYNLLLRNIREYFRNWQNLDLTLPELRRINLVLNRNVKLS